MLPMDDVCVHVTSLNFTVDKIKIACFIAMLIAGGTAATLKTADVAVTLEILLYESESLI